MRAKLVLLFGTVFLLAGCSPVAREPDDLALVRVLGVDGSGPVALSAVCGRTGNDVTRGSAGANTAEEGLALLPWSGEGIELTLTGVSFLVVGPDVDLYALLLTVLEDEELGAAVSVWMAPEGAGMLLEACDDPAANLELLTLRGVSAPTAAQAAARLNAYGRIDLPQLKAANGRLTERGMGIWEADN